VFLFFCFCCYFFPYDITVAIYFVGGTVVIFSNITDYVVIGSDVGVVACAVVIVIIVVVLMLLLLCGCWEVRCV
jgi:hypothetical protein